MKNSTDKIRTKAAAYPYAAFLLFCLLLCLAGPNPLYAKVVVVDKDIVNIRAGASTGANIVGKANKGDVFAWEGASGDWSIVGISDDKTGFIRNDLLLAYDSITVTGTSVRIREAPSLTGRILDSADKGDILEVSGYQKGWFRVSAGQTIGWLSADYARFSSPATLSGVQISAWAAQADMQTSPPEQQDASSANPYASVSVSVNQQEGILSGKVITLDPGHGGRGTDGLLDPGAQGPLLGIWEKDINLDIALKLKTILENMGATVWMTHMGATGMSLYERASVANRNASHIFVSIHANAGEDKTLHGHSVYFYAPASDARLGHQRPLRQTLARYVQESMVQSVGQADLGVKESNFAVLRETTCPSILVETAFLSYPEEEMLLAQGAFRQKLADAIATGILRFFNGYS